MSRTSVSLAVVGGLLLGVGIVGGIVSAMALAGDPFEVAVASGLAPRLSADRAAAVAREDLGRMAAQSGRDMPIDITSVRAVRASEVAVAEPGASAGDLAGDTVVWIVRAHGPFVGTFGRAGAEPPSAGTGYLLINDSGEIIGMGMP